MKKKIKLKYDLAHRLYVKLSIVTVDRANFVKALERLLMQYKTETSAYIYQIEENGGTKTK